MEELCAKYGGCMRAKRAATIIQQTYRQYLMSRSFAKLRLEAGESRRSQRFTRRRGIDGCQHDSIDVDRSLNLSQLCDVVVDDRHPVVLQPDNNDDHPDSALEDGSDIARIGGVVPDTTEAESSLDDFEGQNGLEDSDGSSQGSSPTLPPPLPAPNDLPSVYFESSLESETVCRQHKVCYGHAVQNCTHSVYPAFHSFDPREFPSSYFRHRPLHCYNDRLGLSGCRHRNSPQTSHRIPSNITVRHSDTSFKSSHAYPAVSSSFALFGQLPDHAEPSPIWKRKSGSVESYDASVRNSLEEWDMDTGQSEVYAGSATSSEDAGSIGSGDTVSHQLMLSHQNHTSVDLINHSVNSASSSRSSVLSHSSDRQRKRSYRIGLNLFNRYSVFAVYWHELS